MSDVIQPAAAATFEVGEVASLAVLDAVHHPIIVVGPESGIAFANAAAEDFFSASRNAMRRETVERLFPFGSPVLSLIDQVRKRDGSVNEYRVDVSSPRTGEDRLVDVYGSTMIGFADHVCVMLRERTMAEKIDRQMTHRAAARSVTGLAAMLAHEIKNPLSGIRGAAQLLEGTAAQDDKPLTRLIIDEADRIAGLVDRMEVFSDERPLERNQVNIHVVLDYVKTIARNGFAQGVVFEDRFDPSLPLVYGNRDQLIQVFLNLIKNAAEALEGESEPKITLTTAFKPGMRLAVPGVPGKVMLPLEFCVIDNGPGILPDLRSHLFDPFVTTKTNGSGLGLALVAKIVGDHGGTIECESMPGRTVFRILMPAYDAGALARRQNLQPIDQSEMDP